MLFTHLRDGTEVEDTLVVDARHVEQDVWYVVESIGDEEIEAVNSRCSVPR